MKLGTSDNAPPSQLPAIKLLSSSSAPSSHHRHPCHYRHHLHHCHHQHRHPPHRHHHHHDRHLLNCWRRQPPNVRRRPKVPSSPELSTWRISTWKGEPKRMEKRYQDNQVPTRASSRGNLYCIKPSLFLSPELRHFRGQSLQPGNSIGRETLKIEVLLFLIFPFFMKISQLYVVLISEEVKYSMPKMNFEFLHTLK